MFCAHSYSSIDYRYDLHVVIARRMCLVITAFSLLLKLGLFFVCTRRHARGRRVFRHIWHQLRYFAPACIPLGMISFAPSRRSS